MERAFLFVFLLIGLCGVSLAQSLIVAVPSDVLGDYRRWLGNRDVTNVDSYLGDGVRRDVVEVALFRQALALGCGDVSVEWLEVDSYPRTLLLLREQHIDAAATTVWARDISSSEVALSTAVIPDGQFVAALYSAQNNPVLLNDRSDLGRYSVVSSSHWAQDWLTLQGLPFLKHYDVNGWTTMLRWVASGKADMLLAPMIPSGHDRLVALGVALNPVIGARVVLPGARHFAFRHNALNENTLALTDALSQQLSQCFDQGLVKLSVAGRIEAAYQQSGFWRTDFMAWPVINAE